MAEKLKQKLRKRGGEIVEFEAIVETPKTVTQADRDKATKDAFEAALAKQTKKKSAAADSGGK